MSLHSLARLGAVIAGALLFGCSSHSDDPASGTTPVATQESPATDSQHRVLDAFNVGRDIYVRSLALDAKRGSLWVGTSGGVLEVDLATSNLKSTYTREAGLANEYVFAIHVDKQGATWFGTNGGGVTRFFENQWRTYFPMHGLADYWVYSFGEQSDGNLWIGTWAGVNRLARGSESFDTYVKELVNEWVYGIDVDKSGTVWFGTEGGVSMFDGEAWRSWTHADGLGAPNQRNLPASVNTGLGTRSRHDLSVLREGEETYNPSYVFALHAAADGTIWAGTWGGGVSVFDGKGWRNLTTKDGLAGDIVYAVTQDDKGVFWFGTNQGLSRYDGRTWFTYAKRDGLLDNHVYAVAAVGADVWVGTRSGVARVGVDAATPGAGK